MDGYAILTIVLTAFINFAVSNFIFSRYQKEIEFSFAQQLEQFKADLQKTGFEQQTKFARNHEKMVEAIESLYHKNTETRRSMQYIFHKLSELFESPDRPQITNDEIKLLSEKIDDYRDCFLENRIYLAEETISFVSKTTIFNTMLFVFIPFANVFSQYKRPEVLASNIDILNNHIDGLNKLSNIHLLKLDPNNPNFKVLNAQLIQEYDFQSEYLAKLYKSTTEIKQ